MKTKFHNTKFHKKDFDMKTKLNIKTKFHFKTKFHCKTKIHMKTNDRGSRLLEVLERTERKFYIFSKLTILTVQLHIFGDIFDRTY